MTCYVLYDEYKNKLISSRRDYIKFVQIKKKNVVLSLIRVNQIRRSKRELYIRFAFLLDIIK